MENCEKCKLKRFEDRTTYMQSSNFLERTIFQFAILILQFSILFKTSHSPLHTPLFLIGHPGSNKSSRLSCVYVRLILVPRTPCEAFISDHNRR